MLSQEIIVEMTDRYPFGSFEHQDLPEGKIYVRRIVEYNASNYSSLKEKFDIARKISNPNVVKLEKVLQEEGRFHLLYEYVPYDAEAHLSQFTQDQLEDVKIKLVYLSAYLFENKMQIEFSMDSVGFDRKLELKYYLDIEFRLLSQKLAEVQNNYITQINRLHRKLISQADTQQRKNKLVSDSQQRPPAYSPKNTVKSPMRRLQSMNNEHMNTNREKSVTSHKTMGKANSSANTLELLNHIEMRLGELKITIRKSNNQEHRELRESVKEKWRKEKHDNRKYSGDVNYFSPLAAARKIQQIQSPKSVRHPHKKSFKLADINEASEQENARKESSQSIQLKLQLKKQQQKSAATITQTQPISPQPPAMQHTTSVSAFSKSHDTLSRSSKMKEPKSKIDFEEIKKSEFQSFYKCKQGYVHEFMGLLGDEAPINDLTQSASNPSKSHHHTHTIPVSSSFPFNHSKDIPVNDNADRAKVSNISRQSNESEQDHRDRSRKNIREMQQPDNIKASEQKRNKELKELELRDRITKAIKQSNIALERYRKLSIHTINTEFNKSNRKSPS